MQPDLIDMATHIYQIGDRVAINQPGTQAHGLCGIVAEVFLPEKDCPVYVYGIETGLPKRVYYTGDAIEKEKS